MSNLLRNIYKTSLKTLFLLIIMPSLAISNPGDIITWAPITTDITDSNNWLGGNEPIIGNEAFFDSTASNYTPTLSAASLSNSFAVDLIKISNSIPSPVSYSFFITDNTFFQLNGSFFDPSGVQVVDRSLAAPVQNFYVDGGANLQFIRNTIADVGFTVADFGLPPRVNYNLGTTSPGLLSFLGSSQAGSAGINAHNGSTVLFDVTSLAAIAQINLDTGSSLIFSDFSNASGAIINAQDSSVNFILGSTAFLSTMTLDHSTLSFIQATDVARAVISASNNSSIVIQDNAQISGRAVISLMDSTLTFLGQADSGDAIVVADSSTITFEDNSEISVTGRYDLSNSTLSFNGTSDAGIADINADNGSSITFGPLADGHSARISLDHASTLTFNDHASLLALNVKDANSIFNLNNHLPTTMLFGASAVINNGIVNINPDPTALGVVALNDAFNSYQSITVHRGVLVGNTLNILANVHNFGTIVFNQIFSQGFSGTLTGPGNVVIQGGGALLLANGVGSIQASTVQVIGNQTLLKTEPDLLQVNNLLIGDAALVDFEVPTHLTQTFSGFITDNSPGEHGAVAVNKFGEEGTLILSNPNNNYTGETILYGGTLQIDNAVGVPGLLTVKDNNAAVVFNQTANGTYLGQLAGNGIVSKIGSGRLEFPVNSLNMMQSFNDAQGEFLLNGTLISPSMDVAAGAILSGTGTLTGDLEVFGTIAPGDSQSTFTVQGNLEFEPGSIYDVQIDAQGNSTMIDVKRPTEEEEEEGIVTIENGAAVDVTFTSYDPNATYTIVTADNAVTGTFSALISNPFLAAVLTYDLNHVYLSIESAFLQLGKTFNQKQVARQLATITSPDAEESAILTELLHLPPEQAQHALDQMSAAQYTHLWVEAENMNQRFIRRLYDPLRSIITPQPCCCAASDDCFPVDCKMDMWVDFSWDRSYFKGNCNCKGFKMNGYEVTLGGLQTDAENCLTMGVAATYEKDRFHYNIGGSGDNNSVLGAFYALYRPETYYIVTDFVLGYSQQKVRRPIDVGRFHLEKHSKPRTYQAALYAESGIDFRSCYYLLQPFLGLEIDYCHLTGMHEGDSFLAVKVKGKSHTTASSRLGIHCSFNPDTCMTVAIDAAWQCRLTSLKNRNHERFATFGDEFLIKGAEIHRNSLDGTINLSVDMRNGWTVYAEASGQRWENASSYNLLGGVKFSW